MATIQASSFAFGNIFKHQNALARQEVKEWGENNGFDSSAVPDELPIALGSQVQGRPGKIAEKNNFSLVFNPQATLKNYGNCSFVTVKDESGANSEQLRDFCTNLQQFFEDQSVWSQFAFYELTLDGRIRVGPNHSLTEAFGSEGLDRTSEIHDSKGVIGAIRLTSGEVENANKYYQLLLDAEGANNPQIWQFKYVRRYKELEDYNHDEFIEKLHNIVALTETTNNGD